MKSLGGKPAGARLERIKASPRWAGERFRNLHPIMPGLRDPDAAMPTPANSSAAASGACRAGRYHR